MSVSTYTDGTPVKIGDRIRYRQQPGGLLPAGDWKEGVAAIPPWYLEPEKRARMIAFNEREGYLALDPDEIHMEALDNPGTRYERTAYYMIAGHIVERAA